MTLTLDSPKLRKLTRTQLQSLAKRELVRAIGKTEDIIRRLARKHPKGVPVPEDVDGPGSASLAPPGRLAFQTPREGTPPLSPAPGSLRDRTDFKGKGKQVDEAASPSASSSTEALELLYPEDYYEPMVGPSNRNTDVAQSGMPPDHPVFPSGKPTPAHPSHPADNEDNAHDGVSPPEAPHPGWKAYEEDEDEPDDVYGEVDYPKGAPNHYMVIDALRQFTTLVNDIPSMETRIAEGRCLLQRAETLLDKAMPDARELVVTREYLETFLLAKMKQKRELWDGTATMEKRDRKLRMVWLRAERNAENERRWKECNELYKKNGFKPEPFSAFASHSDEEVIESLQTTPASSGSGSSKRTREESVGGDADRDAHTDDQRQRKRGRV